ncbi:vanillate O-demethylase ferredoxin subunit [Acidocella aromatica]|uniref:Vanillate O-demethylase ferredoxin subunit n=2 Tax=Acidocella aromatica TaxID=1303579 RepID=A0A840VNS8_9PROT|nr:vanillate O-demethylase ferredoxin subunit [Acidocella aromatica]
MLTVQVMRRRVVADNIIALELRSAAGATLPAFSAGAHIDVMLPNGLMRQYSLLNDPVETHRYEIAILRDPNSRGGSLSAHADIREGTALNIGEPRNLFPLAPEGGALLFAGGIGVTPLLAMAHTLHRLGRAFALHYCTRTKSAAAFRDELRAGPFGGAMWFHTDDGPASQKLDAAAVLAAASPGTHIYVCGPAGFIAHIYATARAAGWAEDRLHSESFAATPAAPGGEFNLRLTKRGIVVPVRAEQSALDALLAVGVDLPVSCEQGICGTCVTRVLEGEPEHRDSFLTKAERARNNCFTPCVSRARTQELVLDL